VEVNLHSFLTSALDGGKPPPSSSGRSTPEKKPQYLLNMRYYIETDWKI
jgi:hypothetical protein